MLSCLQLQSNPSWEVGEMSWSSCSRGRVAGSETQTSWKVTSLPLAAIPGRKHSHKNNRKQWCHGLGVWGGRHRRWGWGLAQECGLCTALNFRMYHCEPNICSLLKNSLFWESRCHIPQHITDWPLVSGGDVLITGWKRGSGRERRGWAADLSESTHSFLCPTSQSTLCWKAMVALCLAVHWPIHASIHSANFCFACSGITTGTEASGLQNRHSSCPCGVYSPSGRKALIKGSHTHTWAHVRAQSRQSCLTLRNPTDCNPLGSFVHGISPGKNIGARAISRGSSWPRDWTPVSCVSRSSRQILYCLSPQGSPSGRKALIKWSHAYSWVFQSK